MLIHFLKTTIRRMQKNKFHSAIHICGLSMGLGVFLIILRIVLFETSFNQDVSNLDNKFRIISHDPFNQIGKKEALTPFYLGDDLQQNIPEIQSIARSMSVQDILVFLSKDKKADENTSILFTESSFLSFFNIEPVIGAGWNWLTEPNKAIISESFASQYLDPGQEAGTILTVFQNDHQYQIIVEGIFKNLPSNLDVQADVFISLQTIIPNYHNQDSFCQTYLELHQGSYTGMDKKITSFIESYYDDTDFINTKSFSLQPVSRMHLDPATANNSELQRLYILGLIAILILLIAILNTLILKTAQDTEQLKKTGIQKVLGSDKKHITGQAFTEAFTYAGLAFPLTILFTEIGYPYVMSFLYHSAIPLFNKNSYLMAVAGIMILTIGLIGFGFTIFSSHLTPIQLLNNEFHKGRKRSWVRGIFLSLQLSIFVGLMIALITIHNQHQFLQNKDLGFDQEWMLRIKLPNHGKQTGPVFKQALAQNSDIVAVSGADYFPTNKYYSQHASIAFDEKTGGYVLTEATEVVGIDYDFLSTLNIQLTDGRMFSREFPSDAESSIILNDALIKEKNIKSPIGKTYSLSGKPYTIVGTVQNFHFRSLHEKIMPLALLLKTDESSQIGCRLSGKNIPQTLDFIKATWHQFFPNEPFQYSFIDDKIDAYYRTEQQFTQMISLATFLSILIASMGLLGVALFTARQRTKEIGIRKILGASTAGIVALLNQEFIKWIILSNLIAGPIAYWTLQKWLENFAYRISVSPVSFVIAALASFCITILAVCVQSIRPALANPAEALKYE